MCIYVYYTVVLVPSDPVRSYHGNLKNVCVCVCVCYTFLVVPILSDETRIM